MRYVYCSVCGQKISVLRKALPKYNVIIGIINQHTCSDKVQEFDLTPDLVPHYTKEDGQKFVEKLNELDTPEVFTRPDVNDLKDRRSIEHVKDSTAPTTLLESLRGMEIDGD